LANIVNVQPTIKWTGRQNRRHFLDWLVKENNITIMAEVGVRDGRTTFHLLDQNPNLRIFAIDKSVKGFYNNNISEKYKDRLIAIEAISIDGAQHIKNKSLDLVFIDADHSYNWVKKDIDAYKPKIKPGGYLTGHDIDYTGVNKAVNECVKHYDIGPNNVWFTKI
tara:strand:+ start:515 stop:1009 length:495 start_codon:yes stop_codon:yes gene_type:complete